MSGSSSTNAAAWQPGTQVLYQEVWDERLLVARAVTVVADDGDLLALYSHPQALYQCAALGSARQRLPLAERIAAMMATGPRAYEPRTAADLHVLVLARSAQWNAVWLRWSRDWQHIHWYVNLQQPIRRSARGVQIRDCALDII